MWTRAGTALLLLLAPAAVLAQSPTCRILNYGIFTQVETYESREAPGTAGGKETLAHPRASIERTDRVPARLGLMFGVVHDFDHIPAGGFIAAWVRHPPLPAAEGGTKTHSLLRKEPESVATAFRFDRPDEVIRGDWSFEFDYLGHVLCRQTFTVE